MWAQAEELATRSLTGDRFGMTMITKSQFCTLCAKIDRGVPYGNNNALAASMLEELPTNPQESIGNFDFQICRSQDLTGCRRPDEHMS